MAQQVPDSRVAAPSAAPWPAQAIARRDSPGYRTLLWLRRYGAVAALILLVAITAVINPAFLSLASLRLQLQTFALEFALVAVGQTLVILTGGIDLSVGALLAVGSCLAAVLVNNNLPIPLAFAIPIVLTTLLGASSGVIVTKARIQPIVVTLAMMIAARGLAELITGDATVDINSDTFNNIAITQLGAVPVSVVLGIAVYLLAALFLTRTPLGRYVFAVGGNERAARLSGIAADRVKIAMYAVSGLLAGLAGVLYASHGAQADPQNDGNLFELTTIAAVVVGGTSLLGGAGSVWRTLVGGLILTVLYALFIQAGWSTPVQYIAQGLIIAGAVILQGGGDA